MEGGNSSEKSVTPEYIFVIKISETIIFFVWFPQFGRVRSTVTLEAKQPRPSPPSPRLVCITHKTKVNKMGIDLKAGGRRTGHNARKAPVSKNVYVKLLEKLFS